MHLINVITTFPTRGVTEKESIIQFEQVMCSKPIEIEIQIGAPLYMCESWLGETQTMKISGW